MSLAMIPPVHTPPLAADAITDGDTLVLRLSGVADLRVQDRLMAFLGSAHRAAVSVRAREVRVDVTELEFMNSSCLAEFVRWIEAVQDDMADYRIRFLSNPAYRWQGRSLEALACLNDRIVTVQ